MNVIRDPYATRNSGHPAVSVIAESASPIPALRMSHGNHSNSSGGTHQHLYQPGSSEPQHQHLIHQHHHHRSASRESRPLSAAAAGGHQSTATSLGTAAAAASNGDTNHRHHSRSGSQDSVYTILIRLAPDGATGDDRVPSIKMIHDDVPLSVAATAAATIQRHQLQQSASGGSSSGGTAAHSRRPPLSTRDSEYSLPLGRRISHAPAATDLNIPLNAKIVPKNIKSQAQSAASADRTPNNKKKKKSTEKRQDTKAARTLSAILLSFILTWTPYNILVLIKPLTNDCERCIPQELWDFFYALCYINSLINPMCYALCNASFRRTYIRILTCKWHTRNREAMIRNMYN